MKYLNVEFKYSNANTTGAVVNNLNYGELNQNLEAARFAIRTAGNEFSEALAAESKDTAHTNALLLPVEANSKSEITVILNNAIVHPDQYLWTGDLAANANQHGSFGGNVQLNSQTTFNVVPMSANAIVFKTESLARDVNVTVRVDTANLEASAFNPAVFTGNTTTAISPNISAITPSPYIKEKNSFTQNPIVRLIKIYYPGEWYPPNKAGNPTGEGAGLSYPVNFPFSVAEINGDIISDINYNVTFGGQSYSPYPLNVSSLEQKSDGEINELVLENTTNANVVRCAGIRLGDSNDNTYILTDPVSVRGDAHASDNELMGSSVLALPMVGVSSDYSNDINGKSAAKWLSPYSNPNVITRNGNVGSGNSTTVEGNFYGNSY